MGERMVYSAKYGILKAGEFTITVDTMVTTVDAIPCYTLEVKGYTLGAVGVFAQINDRWVSYIDTSTGLSHKFYRYIRENNYELIEISEFDRLAQVAYVTRKTGPAQGEIRSFVIKALVQDMVSAYFDLRRLDFSKIKKNDTLPMSVFLEDSTYTFGIKCLGKQRIKTSLGKVQSLVFSPVLPQLNSSIFSKEDPIRTYVSYDEYRVPLLIEARTRYGTITVSIEEYNYSVRNNRRFLFF